MSDPFDIDKIMENLEESKRGRRQMGLHPQTIRMLKRRNRAEYILACITFFLLGLFTGALLPW